jgi:hypothetical protein
MQFKTWQQMFDYGWTIDGIDIEEIYQHFKNRMLDEVVAKDNGLARTIEYILEDKEV